MALALGAALLVGCGDEPSGPPPIGAELRESIKQNLMQLGAKVTAEGPEGLYASLRNTHIQLLESGGVVEGARGARQDFQDFGLMNEAVAKGFLDDGEFAEFQQWLRQALSSTAPGADRAVYGRYELSVSQSPLRVVFSRRAPAAE